MKNGIRDNSIVVFASKELFSKDGVFKCVYWYGDRYNVGVSIENENYKVVLRPLPDVALSIEELQQDLLKVERDLIDFNLRDIVTKETKNIRDLLIAKAFSHGEFDEAPPGSVTDPVGFDVDEPAE